ncbi:MAG: hypothetical protein MJ168_08055 [Clostridia bacterium]|nr:hypothetical protein [Clostridia bacterium]
MLNRNDVRRRALAAPRQILANVDMQSSIGCIVPQSIGVEVGNRLYVKAGTPINIDLFNPYTPAVIADGDAVQMNAVLLHDVDVTLGNANGTALIFGFVNVNRVEADVAEMITAVVEGQGNNNMVVFVKL